MKIKYGSLFIFFLITGLASSDSFAQECKGRWNVVVDNSSRINERGNARIPVIIQVENSLRRCFNEGVVIRAKGKEQIAVESIGNSINGFFTSRSQINNGRPLGRGVLLPINRSGRETRLWLNFPNASYASPGSYDALLEFSAADREDVAPKLARARLIVSPFVSMTVNGNSGPSVVDFGVLRKGESQTLDLKIFSNTAVHLSVKSENGHLQHTDIVDSYIPYFLRLNGRNLLFNEVFRLESGARRKNTKLNIQIGETKGSRAGNYLDVVTITATAQP